MNTAGWIDNQGFQLLLNAIEVGYEQGGRAIYNVSLSLSSVLAYLFSYCEQAFKIDVVLVLAHDKLTADLNAALVGSGTTIIKLPR